MQSIRTVTEVQGSLAWTEPTGTLGRLVAEARVRSEALRTRTRELERLAEAAPTAPSFIDALTHPKVAIIAEIKRRSPSKGWINPSIAAPAQAQAYETGGAAAISVLTEPDHFGGSARDLEEVGAAVGIPLLKKDFHVDPVQLLEARALGAAAALLIVRAVSPALLRSLVTTATEIALPVLLEVRDERELDVALDCGARIIGINNRNLETLEIDATRAERLLGRVPSEVVAVAESGVTSRADVDRVAAAGADAVLVGSSISASSDPAAAVRALTGVARVARGR